VYESNKQADIMDITLWNQESHNPIDRLRDLLLSKQFFERFCSFAAAFRLKFEACDSSCTVTAHNIVVMMTTALAYAY
jgi:hypothetical protein